MSSLKSYMEWGADRKEQDALYNVGLIQIGGTHETRLAMLREAAGLLKEADGIRANIEALFPTK